jgi:hypothetical protein
VRRRAPTHRKVWPRYRPQPAKNAQPSAESGTESSTTVRRLEQGYSPLQPNPWRGESGTCFPRSLADHFSRFQPSVKETQRTLKALNAPAPSSVNQAQNQNRQHPPALVFRTPAGGTMVLAGTSAAAGGNHTAAAQALS